jgi:AcrR family transcriptional regulator
MLAPTGRPHDPAAGRRRHAGIVGSMDQGVSRRERKKQQTRRALTRVALTLFLEQGFEATTVDQIAEAADYHRATFFRIFASKEDVALGDITTRFDVARAELEEHAPADEPWQVARRVLTEQALSFDDSDDELEAMHLAVWTTDPALQARFTSMMLDWEATIAAFFAASWGVDPAGDMRCHTIATAMIGVTRSALIAPRVQRSSLRDVLDDGFDLLENGILATIASPPRKPTRARSTRTRAATS